MWHSGFEVTLMVLCAERRHNPHILPLARGRGEGRRAGGSGCRRARSHIQYDRQEEQKSCINLFGFLGRVVTADAVMGYNCAASPEIPVLFREKCPSAASG